MSHSVQPYGLYSLHEAPVLEFSRQKYWSELLFHSPRHLIFSTQGLNVALLHFRQIFHHLNHQRSPKEGAPPKELMLSNSGAEVGS